MEERTFKFLYEDTGYCLGDIFGRAATRGASRPRLCTDCLQLRQARNEGLYRDREAARRAIEVRHRRHHQARIAALDREIIGPAETRFAELLARRTDMSEWGHGMFERWRSPPRPVQL